MAASLILVVAVAAEVRRLLKARDPDIPHIGSALCALVAVVMLAGGAAAHDTSPGACKVEDWRFVSAIAGMAVVEGVTTCTAGEMQLRLYDGAGDGRRFLGASIAFIEGHVFQAMFMDIAKPDNPTIEYAIEEGGW